MKNLKGAGLRGAIVDATANYRYLLWRRWDDQRPSVGIVMLNPSRADATVNDPTIRRCIGFAQRWGYGGVEVGNYVCLPMCAADRIAASGRSDRSRQQIAI